MACEKALEVTRNSIMLSNMPHKWLAV